jgi:uncharacterized protein YajQ (UPF0234 family)
MFKMFCEVVRPLCGGQVRAVAVHRDDGQKWLKHVRCNELRKCISFVHFVGFY